MGAGIAAAGAALLALGPATAEYRNNQAKLETAFKAAGGTARTASQTYKDLYRVLGDDGQTTEAANHLAKLTTNQKYLSEWTDICQGVYATFGDSLPIESLTEAANETAKTGALTGALADALNWAGVNEDKFQESLDKCNTEAEREQLIRETLNGLYQETAAIYEKNNATVLAQNEANAKLQETLAKLGEAMAPVVTAFTAFASEALAVVTPYVQDLAEKYGPKLQQALGKVAEYVEKAMNAIKNNWGTITTIAAVIGGIVAAIGLYNTVAAVKAAMDAAQVATLGGLIAAYAAQAVAMTAALAPYIAIVAAIAAVIAIIVVCVKHWDEIKEAAAKAWEYVKKKTSEAKDAVVKKFDEIKENITEKVDAAKRAVSDKFNEIKANITEKVSSAKETVVSRFNEIKNGITNKINETKNNVSSKFDEIKTNITTKIESTRSNVLGIFDKIKSGITDKINNAKDAVSTAISRIKSIMNFSWSLPKLKLPHISISGKFSINPPSVPKFSISWYKLGGVFDKPTLFGYGGNLGGLGEDGAEAVVPLERNTKWLDKIATMLNEKMGGGAPIVLQVDGKTFAQISVDSINQLTKQTGSLPLKIYG